MWNRFDTCMRRAAWSEIAATSSGWQCPTLITATPPDEIEKFIAVRIPDLGAPTPDQGQPRRIGRHDILLMQRGCFVRIHVRTISVPTPFSVNSSRSSECGIDESMMCTLLTPV